MRRTLFEEEHEDFRATFRTFLDREVVPQYSKWYADGLVPREVFRRLGDLGILGINLPEEHGGSGRDDYRFNVILQEEAARAAIWLGTLRTQLDTIQPYFIRFSNDEQKARWFPGIASGEKLIAVALTEPDTGSDLAGVRTRAERDGDAYVLRRQDIHHWRHPRRPGGRARPHQL